MLLRRLLPRLALLACALLLACAPPREGLLLRVGEALRARFPEQAARVLAAPGAFLAAASGFSAEPRGGVGAELPRRGEGALRFALDPGLTIQVREVGALGEGARAGRAVRYPRAGGASFWAAEEDGYEEWLLLEAGAVRRDAPVAVWEIAGATARQQGDAIALVDAHGEVRLVVTAPEAYAAGGRPIAARLSAREERIELRVDAEGEEVLVDPAWRRTRAMSQGRAGHTATQLDDGRVLVAGGSAGVLGSDLGSGGSGSGGSGSGGGSSSGSGGGCPAAFDPITGAATGCALASAEIYDPTTSTWALTPSMSTPRMGHTATRLPDGTVLVVGGIAYDDVVAGTAAFATTERYDPATGKWEAAAPMKHRRAYHVAVPLEDGRVLVAGGLDSVNAKDAPTLGLTSAEVFDPATGAWTDAGAMHSGRLAGHTATVLTGGTVLVVGGTVSYNFVSRGSVTTRGAEVFNPTVDPMAGSPWKTVGSLVTFRSGHTASLLGQDVLVTGGDLSGAMGTAEIYTPSGSGAGWTLVGAMKAARYGHTATVIQGGQVILAGGVVGSGPSAEMYTSGGGFVAIPSMSVAREGHTATPFRNGQVLVTGGIGDPNLASAEVYDGEAHRWTPTARMAFSRVHHTATVLADGQVLVAGGLHDQSSGAFYQWTAEVYDPHLDAWSLTRDMTLARSGHTATLLRSGQVLVAGGGYGYALPTQSAELYTPGDRTWARIPVMSVSRYAHVATTLADGRVLVTGGFNNDGFLQSAEIYDPDTDAWTGTDAMNVPRYAHTATLLADGRVLVTGGRINAGDGDAASDLAELWDPNTGKWTPAHSMGTSRGEHAAILLDGLVLVTGGTGVDRLPLQSAETYDPVHDKWTPIVSMNGPHVLHTATALGGGIILVAGGDSSSAETFDPAGPGGPTWSLVASMGTVHEYSAIAPLGGGRVLVTGGILPSTTPGLSTTEMFEPERRGAVCAGAFECASGSCLGGVCCDSVCNVGCTACSIADGAVADGQCTRLVACGDFACKTQSPPFVCFSACSTAEECAVGFVCDASHDCVPPVDAYVDTCALSPAPLPRRPFEPAVLLLVAIAAVRRRAARRAAR